MKKKEDNKSMTIEDLLQDPSFAHVHDALRYVMNTPASQLIPKKHELVLTDLVEQEIKELYNQTPNLPIKKVLSTIFEALTDDIPAPLMLKLTKKIINKWHKLSTALPQVNQTAVAA